MNFFRQEISNKPIKENPNLKVNNSLLQSRLQLPLELKIKLSQMRIEDWYRYYGGKVYVAFSGGKDSTVLLHLVRDLYPDVPAVFNDTGLEFPEIREFVKTIKNVVWLKPKMNFKQIIEKYGYPVVSKEVSQYIHDYQHTNSEKFKKLRWEGRENSHNGKIPEKWKYLVDAPFKISDKCCDIMKKNPAKVYEKETGRKPIIGTMVGESTLRKQSYMINGCNAFDLTRPKSVPIAFWKEEDIWNYIKQNNISYSKIYDMGYQRTGCVFCMFGAHNKKDNRFQKLCKTHPKLYKYCMNNLNMRTVLEYIGINIINHDDVFFQCEKYISK